MFPTQLNVEDTGHNPDVLIAALVHNREKDKFLVAKRRGTLGKGKFDTPGGKLEYGETFLACATREVRRETGLEANAKSVVSVTGDVWGEAGWEKHFITIFVLCDLKDDQDPIEIKPANESDEWVWRSWEELRTEKEREIPLPLATILEENPTEKALLKRSLYSG